MEDNIKKTGDTTLELKPNDNGDNLTLQAQEIPPSIIAESENVFPMVAMKGLVIFPNVATSFNVGRAKSLKALNLAKESAKNIFLVAQRDKLIDDPTPSQIYTVGVVCKIKRMFHFEGNVSVHIEGLYRAKITEYVTTDEYFSVKVEQIEPIFDSTESELTACINLLKEKFRDLAPDSDDNKDKLERILAITDPDAFVNIASFKSEIMDDEKQSILQTRSVLDRAEQLLTALVAQEEVAEMGKRISERVRKNVEKGQKEYYLREQLRAIHQELGDDENERKRLERQYLLKNFQPKLKKRR